MNTPAKKPTKAAPYIPGGCVWTPPVRTQLTSAPTVRDVCQDIAEADKEHFVAFTLDVRHRIIARHVISIGCLNGVDVHPRELFKAAILDSAAAIIIAHNHPSGDCTPSRADLELTKRLVECGTLLGISVLDHVIVTKGGGYSSIIAAAQG